MNRTLCTLTALLLAFLAAPGAALHCNGDITTIGTGATTLYLDDRSQAVGEIDHWVYLEDNGIGGLQSGDWECFTLQCWPFSISDTCSHSDPDLLVF